MEYQTEPEAKLISLTKLSFISMLCSSVSGADTTSKFRTIVASAMRMTICAIFCPPHTRGPCPKGNMCAFICARALAGSSFAAMPSEDAAPDFSDSKSVVECDGETEGTVMTAGSSMIQRLGRKSSGLKKMSGRRCEDQACEAMTVPAGSLCPRTM